MRVVGSLKKVDGMEIEFQIDERLDLEELRRLSVDGKIIADIAFHDKRAISPIQRKKAYALIRDVSRWTGYSILEAKEQMKVEYILQTGEDWISLGDCSMSEARSFISIVMEFCFEHNIPFKDKGLEMTDDINHYLFICIKHRKCAICGKRADIHHVDTVGMGRDRRKVDNSENRLIALCRNHHTEVHQRGQSEFDSIHHVQGIKVNEATLKRLKLPTKKIEENDQK